MSEPHHPHVELQGVRIHLVNRGDLLRAIARAVETGRGGIINNVNAHAMNVAYRDPEFRAILNGSDLVFVDGFGVQLAAWIAGLRVGERLTFGDWMDDLFRLCAQRRWSLFLLGDTDEVGADFARELARRHPGCRLAGRHHGFFEKTGPQNDAVVEAINASGAQILLVGMSMPIQEKWAWANKERLLPAVRLASGGFARIYTGRIQRGPRWMTQYGLEWLYRLAVQPRYTWRRYLLGNPLFLWRVLLARLHIGRRPPARESGH
jgi:N-acetylglucosaminyldiphosphoundecaprenol N-acetyl-beta-D-mannosaminyltransferase